MLARIMRPLEPADLSNSIHCLFVYTFPENPFISVRYFTTDETHNDKSRPTESIPLVAIVICSKTERGMATHFCFLILNERTNERCRCKQYAHSTKRKYAKAVLGI